MSAFLIIPRPGVSSCLISPRDNDSFYNPISMGHTGFAYDGTHYNVGIQQYPVVYASWYTEGSSPNRGTTSTFPSIGIALLSQVDLTIYDESNTNLPLWMRFILADSYLLANNFDGLHGFTPNKVSYAEGVISVVCDSDPGLELQTTLVINIDFSQDSASIEFLEPTY